MRGKRELPRKRPPILLFVLIFAAGNLRCGLVYLKNS